MDNNNHQPDLNTALTKRYVMFLFILDECAVDYPQREQNVHNKISICRGETTYFLFYLVCPIILTKNVNKCALNQK